MPVVTEILLLTQLAIGLVFLRSSLGKLRHPGQFATGMSEYRLLPASLVQPSAILIIAAELLIAVSHLTGVQLQYSVLSALALLSMLVVATIATMWRGLAVPCLCFSGGEGQMVSKRTVARLALLLSAEFMLWLGLWSGVKWPAPYNLDAAEVLIAVLCAGLTLNMLSWILATPEIVASRRNC